MADLEEKKNGSDVFAQALKKKKMLAEQADGEKSDGQEGLAARPGVGFGSGVSRSRVKEASPSDSADSEAAQTDAAASEAEKVDSEETAPAEAEDGIEFFEIGEMPDAVVEAGEPDITGKAAIAAGGLIVRVLRPFVKLLNVFFAPVIKPFKKGAGKITARDWALFVLLLLAVAAAVIAPSAIVRMQNTHKTEDSLYAPISGQTITWEGGTFYYEDGDLLFTTENGTTLDMTGTPFYYTDGSGILLPDIYMWYSVSEVSFGKLERYSHVEESGLTSSVITLESGAEFEKSGFLYDNADTYIVLERATLEYNGQSLYLPPLSYVRVNNSTNLQVYVYGGESILDTLTTDAVIYFDNGSRLDTTGDILYFPNGTFWLVYCYLDGISILSE